MLMLKQSTAITVKIGPFLDDTDGYTAETALTITQAEVRLSMNGGNMAQKTEASACTHDELGYYDCDIDATDTGTLGRLQLMVYEAGALPVWHEFMVVPSNTYDSLVSGSDYLDTNAEEIEGAAALAGINAQVADVMKTDTIAEMAQQIPPTTPTFEEAVMYLYMALTKEAGVTATLQEYNNEAGTVIWKQTLADDGTTFSKTKGASGP